MHGLSATDIPARYHLNEEYHSGKLNTFGRREFYMQIKTEVIVLSSVKYGDASLIVNCYTPIHGRLPLMFKGIRNRKKGLRPSMFMPLNRLEMEISFSAKRELQFAKDVSTINILNNIHLDPIKNSVAIFLSEVLYKTLKEEEANELLFQFLCHSFDFFNESQGNSRNLFHLKFLLELSRFLGFYPENNRDEKHSEFSPHLGRFEQKKPDSHQAVEIGSLISELLKQPFEALNAIQANGTTISLVLENIVRLYLSHMTTIKEFKSYNIFKNM